MLRHLIVLFVVLVAVSWWWIDVPSQVVARQVKNAPMSQYHAPLLDLTRHARHSDRPEETFNFPITEGQFGPVKPLYAGSLQYPFYCMSLDSKLGQPIVDRLVDLNLIRSISRYLYISL